VAYLLVDRPPRYGSRARVVKSYLSVGRPKKISNTAERLMDLAESHIRDAGYHGYSFRDLAVEAGIKSSSVHHHFPTKAALSAAVMRRYTDNVLAAVADATDRGGADAITAYRSVFRTTLLKDGRMCLGGALGAEAGGLPPEVAQAARDFFRRLTSDLSDRIGGPDARPRAQQVLATLEGAMILARALGDTDAFDKATATLA
jgi:TetR/AcrR family transcriptional repressor of nem operon